MKILIADDDTTSRVVLQATLKKLGHEVISTKNGKEAFNLFEAAHVSLVISDVVMPEMDGLTLCKKIREANRSRYTYVILLTTISGKNGCLVGLRYGADDFITKPFDEDILAARLLVAERLLKIQSQMKQLAGLLPMCCVCKKIRDDQNFWTQVENYISEHTDASFTHGYCPTCFEKVKKEIEALEV